MEISIEDDEEDGRDDHYEKKDVDDLVHLAYIHLLEPPYICTRV